jgi:hypothetical protein
LSIAKLRQLYLFGHSWREILVLGRLTPFDFNSPLMTLAMTSDFLSFQQFQNKFSVIKQNTLSGFTSFGKFWY